MKHDDRRRVFGLTWIGWANLLALQWIGLRLAAVVEPPDDTHVGYTAKRYWPLAGWRMPYKIASIAWLFGVLLFVTQLARWP